MKKACMAGLYTILTVLYTFYSVCEIIFAREKYASGEELTDNLKSL